MKGMVALKVAAVAAVFSMGQCCLLANAQSDDGERHVLFTANTAFIAGDPTQVCTGWTQVYPAPNGRYAIIVRHEKWRAAHAPFLEENSDSDALTPYLLLYDSHTGRATTILRQAASDSHSGITDIEWLANSEIALVVLIDNAKTSDTLSASASRYTLLYLHPTNAGLSERTLLDGEDGVWIYPSQNSARAIIGLSHTQSGGEIDETMRYVPVDERGYIGPEIAVSPLAQEGNWNKNGTTWYFWEAYTPDADSSGAAPLPMSKTRWYQFDALTQRLTQIDKEPADRIPFGDEQADNNPLKLVSAMTKAIAPTSGDGQGPTAKLVRLAPLWAVRSDGKTDGGLPTALLIAPDAVEGTVLADDSAILYKTEHALFAVPITRRPREVLESAVIKRLQADTMLSAQQVFTALSIYARDNGGSLPTRANLASALTAFFKDGDVGGFAGMSVPPLTYLAAGKSLSLLVPQAATLIGYLAGPGGRAAIYADGHVTWEESAPPVKTGRN